MCMGVLLYLSKVKWRVLRVLFWSKFVRYISSAMSAMAQLRCCAELQLWRE